MLSSESLKNTRTSLLAASAQNKRTNLYRQITQWRLAQDVYMPGVSAYRQSAALPIAMSAEHSRTASNGPGSIVDGCSQEDSAEYIRLLLPFEVPSLASQELRMLEMRLRKAQTDDALAAIRRLRRAIAGLSAFKRTNVHGMGNRSNTRMQSLFSKMRRKIELAKQRYRIARTALMALEPDAEWNIRLRDLRDEDIRGPNREDDEEDEKKRKKRNQTGEGRYEPSWIWFAPGAITPSDGSGLEYGDSVRVEWTKAKARVERWEEEILLLSEEMRRVLRFLEWKSAWWEEQQEIRPDAPPLLKRGLSAYASKQSAIYSRLASVFADQWIIRLRKLHQPPSWLSDIPNFSIRQNTTPAYSEHDYHDPGCLDDDDDDDVDDTDFLEPTDSNSNHAMLEENDLLNDIGVPSFPAFDTEANDFLSDDE